MREKGQVKTILQETELKSIIENKMSLDFPRWLVGSRNNLSYKHGHQDRSRRVIALVQKRNQLTDVSSTGIRKDLPYLSQESKNISHLWRVDELISQALGDGLDVPEGGLTGSSAQQPNSLVDTAQGRHIDGLTTHGTGTSDTGGVFTGAGVHDGQDQDLQNNQKVGMS